MKSKLIGLALFVLTATTVAFYPIYNSIGAVNTSPPNIVKPVDLSVPPVNNHSNVRPKVEVVFALDTTGSMSGLIQAAKEKIWSIASTMAQAQPAPEIRMGLVAYRDRGDEYITRVVDLSADLDTMYATLMDFRADGGGDGPESVNQALYDSVHNMNWSQDPQAYKVVFLVGDAPPHMDYADDVKYPQIVKDAQKRNIIINTIQCGHESYTTGSWQHIAQLGQGNYFQVEQAGSAVAITTPYDAKLAELSSKLDKTRLYYGSKEAKAKAKRKQAATDKLQSKSSVESRARRAAFNASKSGKSNLLGENELVEDVASGRVDLSKLDKDQLPEPLQSLPQEQQQKIIKQKNQERQSLLGQIQSLTKQRSAFLRDKVEEAGGAKESLDNQIYSTVRQQAEKKGLHYEAAAPSY
jgi:Mg-chelatase subunit ChlD